MKHSIRVALAVALQLAILVTIAGARQWTLRTGTVVLLETVPVDPRDLFRGDYVVLAYKISTLGPGLPGGPLSLFNAGDPIYVLLEQRGRFWETVSVSRSRPAEGIFIRGRVVSRWVIQGEVLLRVEYGIESYFIPEGTGRRIEAERGNLAVEVALRDGNAVIRRLYIGAEPLP